jgi:hypothetical protein
MGSTILQSSRSNTWLQTLKREVFYFCQLGVLVIAIGFYLYPTRLFVADTILIQYILTLLFDQLFSISMTLAGIGGIVG